MKNYLLDLEISESISFKYINGKEFNAGQKGITEVTIVLAFLLLVISLKLRNHFLFHSFGILSIKEEIHAYNKLHYNKIRYFLCSSSDLLN